LNKIKLKLIDTAFAHCEYSNNPMPPTSFSKYIEWDRNVSDTEDVVFYTENNIRNVNVNGHKKRIAWLIEPYIKQRGNYEWLSENNHLFDYVLVNEKTLVDKGENFIFFPFGGCWIEEENRKFHDKTKIVSIVCSHKKAVPDHHKRHELIQKFGHVIDVMGRGYKPIGSITEGLKDYAFHIAMENMRRDSHFSEKLINPIMTGTIPIYWGMPSIGEYFDTRGMIIMNDINDFESIYNSLGESLYKKMLPYAKDNFETAKKYILSEDWLYENKIFEKMGII
tara:strand:+ start:369 stop:1208 length:840 start_codon:yes stop_codon:yes gene_type:complete